MLDASAVVDLLSRNEREARITAVIEGALLVSPAHVDAETLSGVARLHRTGMLSDIQAEAALSLLSRLPMTRLPIDGRLLEGAWSLRANVAMRDALYVATAQHLDIPLVTTDERLRRAVPGVVVDLD